MEIKIARSQAEIAACYPVMRELRPHISQESFVARIREQEKSGFFLAFVSEASGPVAVAGYRFGKNLAWGKHLYVDDLVSLPDQRSRGYGRALLAWLADQARQNGCGELHLDSGLQRLDAHRFYLREKMDKTSFHFRLLLSPEKAPGGNYGG